MALINYIGAISSASKNKKNNSIPQQTDWTECKMEYGEICYKCMSYIGDAVGEPRLCEKCKPKK